jgi:hypothetical protein
MFPTKVVEKNQNTRFMFSDFLPEIVPKNKVEPERVQTIWHLRMAH